MSDPIVVTGAALGIGKAITRQLVAEGVPVVAVDWNEAALAKTIGAIGGTIEPIVGDVGDWETHERAARAAESHGRLVGWVNNAGIDIVGAAHEVTPEEIDRGLRVLQLAPMYGTSVAVKRMLAAGCGGSIVNISSVQGFAAFPRYYTYQAAKAAVIMISKGVSVDYGPFGIRCNAVCPGAIHTTLGRDIPEEALADLETWDDFAPIGRVGWPEEIAECVCFLLSERASFVTGATLVADGGASARCYVYPIPDEISRAARQETGDTF